MRYELLWADDDWSTDVGDTEKGHRRSRLEYVCRTITDRLVSQGIEITWVTDTLVSDSVTRLHETDADFRLAVVDLDFGEAPWGWQSLELALAQAHIPVVFYTAFPEKLAPYRVQDNVRCVGVFEKQKEDAAFADRVVAFCLAPPFHLVHISDIHFDTTAQSGARHEQEALLGSLVEALLELNRKRPIDLVAFSGDFAHSAAATDLKEVRPFVSEIIGATVGHSNIRKCVAVAGNHDMVWDSYDEGRLARQPWADYADFCCAVFNTDVQTRAELGGWDNSRQLLATSSDGLGLCWARRLQNPPISIVGLVSTTDSTPDKGSGDFRPGHQKLLRSAWSDGRVGGEVRLCLMHHNLLAPLSLSRMDEKSTIKDAGAAMLTLLERGCHVVLSGHVHTSQIIRFQSIVAGPHGDVMGSLIVIGTGPTGGTHAAKDRPRSFSCLEFGDGVSGSRALTVIHFEYDGRYRRWKERPPFVVL